MQDYVLACKTITLVENEIWTLHIFDKLISKENEVLSHLPKFLNKNSAAEIFSFISNAKVCSGNDMPKVIKNKIINLTSKEIHPILKKDLGIIETKFMNSLNDFSIIRSTKCSFLINSNDSKVKCENCTKDMNSLVKYKSLSTKCINKNKKKYNNKKCNKKKQLLIKIKELQRNKKVVASRTSSLKKKVRDYFKKEGVSVDLQTNELLQEKIRSQSATPFKKDSSQYFFWKQQVIQSSFKNSRAMIWHPLIIKWCLSIYLKSPGTYKHIRCSPFLFLPCKNTLLKYIYFTDPSCGFNVDIIQRLFETLKPYDMKESEKNVTLIFDEMKIKSGLVFCKTTGKMVGFTVMGPINDTLNEFHRRFESRVRENDSELNLAQYVVVFIVRGIFSSLCYYFGQFASEVFNSDQIYSCTWNAIMILESIGLKVRAIVSDGATRIRKFYNLHKMDDSSNMTEGVV
ncbi:uncharacterized protein LOC124806350 [Hydra vulgaris]|uniref:uncharacterized protein LOC124806350 n=1 Tax=Hydra vulgaris TaxID=6087 RepID=UPI001F5F77C0|nr:uncharacterized protein LOC124806350 [Hydra vulgaris]